MGEESTGLPLFLTIICESIIIPKYKVKKHFFLQKKREERQGSEY